MAEYEVELAPPARKEFRDLPAEMKRRVLDVLHSLQHTPRPVGVRKLGGFERLYRVRVGDYRVVYEIHDERPAVRVTRIRHRKDVYL